MEFTSSVEGAESVDIKGLSLPKQIFQGKTFYLLQDVTDYVGKGLYQYQKYLVQVRNVTMVCCIFVDFWKKLSHFEYL